jgi:hypothetical protein
MNDELDKRLCEKYPKIFRDRMGSMQETCMCWGFDHADGWYNLIDAACINIQSHTNQKRKREPFASMTDEEFDEIHQPVASQVKEKFGGLRFYIDNADEYVHGIIAMAESLSYRTCEQCGNTAIIRKGGWIKTLCDGCNSK